MNIKIDKKPGKYYSGLPFLCIPLVASVILCFHFLACANADRPPSPPNVVIIFTDDQGYQDVGCFGSPDILTPHLDAMARNGCKLTNFYAAQAVCSASRAGLLTGCYPNRLGIHGAFMPRSKRALDTSEVTIAEMLKEKGYATAIYGKWHLGDHPDYFPTRQGFDEFYGILYSNDMWPYHPQQGPIFDFKDIYLYDQEQVIDTLTNQDFLTTSITERSVQFIEQNADRPFFLYVPHPQPHVPLFVSKKFEGKSERGLYGDVIMEIDWSVGEILEALRRNKIEENTLVIFTSDNGPWLAYGNHAGSALPLREGKGTALEGGQREPFIAQFPGKIPGGTVIDQPMMAIDILPTIAELTDVSLPNRVIDGQSGWNLLTGQTNKSPQEAYYFYYHQNELHGVRYKNWKMYFPHRYRTLNGKPGGMDGQPGNYEYLTFDTIALYDLHNDISEVVNVAAENPAVIDTILQYANIAREELGDKLVDRTGRGLRQPVDISWD